MVGRTSLQQQGDIHEKNITVTHSYDNKCHALVMLPTPDTTKKIALFVGGYL